MYHVGIAYLLWFVGGFGALGFHRFYLGKIPTGVLWLCTGGLSMVGSIYDFFTLGTQVMEANQRKLLLQGMGAPRQQYIVDARRPDPRKEDSLERKILRIAKARSGAVSAGEVALEADVEIAKAREALDKLAKSGDAEMKVRTNGTIVYFFSEFAPAGRDDFLDI